jgi:hypothetical protein
MTQRPIRPNTRWISAMFYLPSQPSRACLISFWLAITVLTAFLVISVSLLVTTKVSSIGAVAIPILGLVGLCSSNISMAAYTAWSRATRVIGNFSQILLLRICFDIIFTIVGWANSRIRLERPADNESMWVSRETLPSNTYFSQHRIPTAEISSRRWISSFVSWTGNSGDLLPCCLVPLLFLLRSLTPTQESKISADLYTLY